MARRILLITDQPQTGREYQHSLQAAGHDVRLLDAGLIAEVADSYLAIILFFDAQSSGDPLALLRQVKSRAGATPVVMLCAGGSVEIAVAAMKLGAAEFLAAPCPPEKLLSVLAALEERENEKSSWDKPSQELPGEAVEFEGMLSRSPAMLDVFDLVRRIAPTDSTVLLTGESGTGKEMVVRAIHRLSRRREQPLLACDCTALAPTLLESELFGHVKGSFSGAIATKLGLLEVAHQGTLFLDEVANLTLETQGKLLRVLETRRVRKVGDTTEHEVDIRLIAASNRSLAEMVKSGAFRADLYYRLNVVPIVLPPLRERPGDVALLAETFLRRFSEQMGLEYIGFSEEALRLLERYHWPGNVRELRNIVERLAVLYGGSRIEASSLPWEVRDVETSGVVFADASRTWSELKRRKRQVIAELERQFLMTALQEAGGNITRAAERVGLQRTNFHALLRKHHLR